MPKTNEKQNNANGCNCTLSANCNPELKHDFKDCFTKKGFATEAEAIRYLVRNFIESNKDCQG